MWPKTDLLDLLQIEHPILLAPMGGETTPQMASAVANAGGLGGLGCSYMSNSELAAQVSRLRELSDKPFNLNFFVNPPPRADAEVYDATLGLLAPFHAELGVEAPPFPLKNPCVDFDHARLQCLLQLRPRVVSFHFGLPEIDMVRALQDAGSLVISSATTVDEARRLDAAGIDAIIAQGWEAGGHRGSFGDTCVDRGVGGLALIPQVVDAVNLPVIAAGGIADGRGIAAACMLGASGVQLGTAFLACPEARVSDAWRAAMRNTRDDATCVTPALSGRPARAMHNRFIEAIARADQPLPDYPTMYAFSEALGEAATARATPGFETYFWGQAAAMSREMSCAELVRLLVDETSRAFASVAP